MNETWSEIVDVMKPLDVTQHPKDLLMSTVESFFRMLGWRKSNGTMVKSKSNTDCYLTLVAKDSNNEQSKIATVLCGPIEESYVEEILKADSTDLCIEFSDAINIYFLDSEVKSLLLISQIPYDGASEDGAKLCSALNAKSFDRKQLKDFIDGFLSAMKQNKKIEDEIIYFATDPGIIKSAVISYLVNEGYPKESVENLLSDFVYGIDSLDNAPKPKPALKIQAVHDLTRFSIDGVNFFPKKTFVTRVVQRFVSEHPDVTYEELEEQFPSEIISKKRGVVRPISLVHEWMKENPSVAGRFNMKPADIITLKDGMKLVVHNQWGDKHFPKFLKIALSLYPVYSTQPYGQAKVKTGDNTPDSNEQSGIHISPQSLLTFSQTKK